MDKLEAIKVSSALKSYGFSGLEDPNLVVQLAFMVQDHEHFRRILACISGKERVECYEAMRPHLTFQAKPLDVYIADSARKAAERETLQSPLDVLAEQAIKRAERAKTAKGSLKLVCVQCTKEQLFMAVNKDQALADASEAGWTLRNKKEVCPECYRPVVQ